MVDEMQLIARSISDEIRRDLTWDDLWHGPDGGLIKCWENGRAIRASTIPEHKALANAAENGELPILDWIGGVSRTLKSKKYGSLQYLATLQGLKGQDLQIDLAKEVTVTCALTKTEVIFTGDKRRFE